MDITSIAHMRDEPSVLISGLRVGPLAWDVVYTLSMLPLVTGDHVNRLLKKVEIEVLIAEGRCEIKISIYECL